MTRVLLIDDDYRLSEMLNQYLTNEGFEIIPAFSGFEGEAAIAAGMFDAVILDIMLPDMNGLDVLRRIRAGSDIPIIMLTAKGDDVDRVVGLEMGADDYLAKPYFPRELLARLRARTRREPRPRTVAALLTCGDLALSTAQREVTWRGKAFELTTTEFNMLAALMRSGVVVLTKDDLSLALLGRPREQYDRSIDAHAAHLRKKLAQATGDRLEIETVRAIGYRLKLRS
jgi:two-component system OmpR family response regulator